MDLHLVTRGFHRQSIGDVNDSAVVDAADGSVIFMGSGSATLGGRPYLVKVDGDLMQLPYDVSRAWTGLPSELRGQLVENPDAPLSNDAVEAVSAPGVHVAAGFFVGSSETGVWRVGGELKRFVELLAELND